jgi:broad specificity phosphatase PhoE
MAGTWGSAAPELAPWCDSVVDALLGFDRDTVVVTHFVAINVALGRATGDDRVVCAMPANCSVTTLESDGRALHVVDQGPADVDAVVT